jgi:quinohemoprotein ethanol dehydrogenase
MVFALDAHGVTLPPAPPSNAVPAPPRDVPDPAAVTRGEALYAQNCAICHGASAVGGVKDLRHLTKEVHADFLNIVLGGKREKLGMPNFGGKLTEAQAKDIHAYLIKRAQDDYQPNFMDLVKRQ